MANGFDEAWLAEYQAKQRKPELQDIIKKHGFTGGKVPKKKAAPGKQKRPLGANQYPSWSTLDTEILRLYYTETPEGLFSIPEIAAKLSRSENAITLKAARLGLTNKSRKASTAAKKRMSEVQTVSCNRAEIRESRSKQSKDWLDSNPHPKGFAGRKHSEESLQKISAATRTSWANPLNPLNSPEYRQSLSDRFSGLSRASSQLYSRGKGGKRADIGDMYFRSIWEANYARYLNFLIRQKVIHKWEYEPETFWFTSIKKGTRTYTPDFKIWVSEHAEPYFDEVKGWMDQKSKTKLSRMKRFYPHITVNVIGPAEYKQLSKTVGGLIPNWERAPR